MYIADEAYHLDRLKPPRSSRNAAAGAPGHRPGTLYGSAGRDRSGRQAVEGIRRGAGDGDRGAYRTDAYRAVYTAHFDNAVYVLRVFQKKSKSGIATPKHEIELIRRRLAEAERHYRERQN